MKLIGTKSFYRTVLKLAIPLMIQNAVTNFVSLLDNIMVGRTGTEPMSGVSIANQLMFVFNLSIFGAVSGASIFGAQFFGLKDYEGMKHTLRIKLMSCVALAVIFILVYTSAGDFLLTRYLLSGESQGDVALTLMHGSRYLSIMLLGLIPYAVAMSYAGTLREMGETFVPMLASVVAVVTNLVLNYILIFGKFGAPELGVEGAAIATVVSRFIELFIVVIRTHLNTDKYPFAVGLYKSFKVPANLLKQVMLKGTPLLMNEFLWSVATATAMQCYSMRGLEVVAALNISSTISNLFSVVYMSLGSSISIVVGPLLGAGKMKEAKETAIQMLAFSVGTCFVIGLLMASTCKVFPMLYNTSDQVRDLAGSFILICSCCMPMYSYSHASYFIIRTGGKTGITFLFDSMFQCCIIVPLAYCLSRFTGMNILLLYTCCQLTELIKCTIGTVLINKGIWINNLVADGREY